MVALTHTRLGVTAKVTRAGATCCQHPAGDIVRILWCCLVAGVWWGSASSVLWAEEFDVSKSSIPVEAIRSGGPPKDGIPAILTPELVPANQAVFVKDDDLVVGIAREGVARAYPLRILNWHEVVNDTLADHPVVVTWCPLTQSALVFDRQVQGTVRTFGVSGRLFDSNVLLYDHQSESLWSQLQEGSVTGPQTGAKLVPIPARLIAWGAWKQEHPDTLVLSRPTGSRRDYDRDPYVRYRRDPGPMFPVRTTDDRLAGKSKVLGIMLNGMAKAYPLTALRTATQPVIDELAGQTIHVRVDPDGETAFARDAAGRLLHATVLYWFAWATFHPDTLLYEPAGLR